MVANLTVQAYDTLSIARNLENNYEFDKKQAEGIARTIHEHLVSNVATREDLEKLGIELRGEMAELRGEMAELRGELRGEMVKVNSRIDDLSKTMTIRTGAMIVTAVGLLAALQAITG
ncbi:MAG: hypothetical protein F4239_07030 [Gammaproteobacteria bacterium]|nr:hypothetical protein [Gammaproteobacteria bacterium]